MYKFSPYWYNLVFIPTSMKCTESLIKIKRSWFHKHFLAVYIQLYMHWTWTSFKDFFARIIWSLKMKNVYGNSTRFDNRLVLSYHERIGPGNCCPSSSTTLQVAKFQLETKLCIFSLVTRGLTERQTVTEEDLIDANFPVFHKSYIQFWTRNFTYCLKSYKNHV